MVRPVPDSPSVVAVVVTWNRRALLAEALRGVAAQSTHPRQEMAVQAPSVFNRHRWMRAVMACLFTWAFINAHDARSAFGGKADFPPQGRDFRF